MGDCWCLRSIACSVLSPVRMYLGLDRLALYLISAIVMVADGPTELASCVAGSQSSGKQDQARASLFNVHCAFYVSRLIIILGPSFRSLP